MEEFSLTLVIVIITGLISYRAFNNQGFKSRLLFIPDVINRTGQYERFLTHGFIHADWWHLLINMFVLYSFGVNAEYYLTNIHGEVFGSILYLVLYFGGIIVASIPTFFKHKESPYYSALGASGAVSAVVFMNVFFAPWDYIYLYGVLPIPFVIGAIAYLGYSDYMGRKGNDLIGHDTHFWGAVWGFVFIFVLAAIMNFELITRFFELLLNPGLELPLPI
jgi:membrane associated rhomboid family serine protease